MPKEIYLDNAASTPIDPRVLKAMEAASRLYANPSSFNNAGREARQLLDNARLKVARFLGAHTEEVIFTSSGSEANNLALYGVALTEGELLTTPIEHPSVLNPAKDLKATPLLVDGEGKVDLGDFKKKLNRKIKMVSVMYANNEIGTIQPIIKISKIIKEFNQKLKTGKPEVKILLHVDACQAAGYLPMNVNQLGVDMLTFNGAKIYGPKGVGVLYVRRGIKIKPLIQGGSQEFGLRAGTENLVAIAGLQKALEIIDLQEAKSISWLRDYLIERIGESFPEAKINGPLGTERLPNNISVSFPGIDIERLLLELDKYGVRAGSGSACTSREVEPSHVLVAIDNEKKYIHALRLSLGKQTKKRDLDVLLNALYKILGRSYGK